MAALAPAVAASSLRGGFVAAIAASSSAVLMPSWSRMRSWISLLARVGVLGRGVALAGGDQSEGVPLGGLDRTQRPLVLFEAQRRAGASR